MDVKMNLRMKAKNHAVDSKIGSTLKIVFRAGWTHGSISTAWDLKNLQSFSYFSNFPCSQTYARKKVKKDGKRAYIAQFVYVISKERILKS